MEYYACGSGSAKLKENVNKEKLRRILDNLMSKENIFIEYDLSDTDKYISFDENDDHWHEEDTMKFLDALIPYITEGSAEYYGEYNENWRYVFQNGEWDYQAGVIYYTVEDMIKELESRVYTVTLV